MNTWEFQFPGLIHQVSDDIRSFAGTSYPPIAKSNEGCPQKALYVKITVNIASSVVKISGLAAIWLGSASHQEK